MHELVEFSHEFWWTHTGSMILIALGGLSEENLFLLLCSTIKVEQRLYPPPHAEHAVAGERKTHRRNGDRYVTIRKHSM